MVLEPGPDGTKEILEITQEEDSDSLGCATRAYDPTPKQTLMHTTIDLIAFATNKNGQAFTLWV